MKVWPWLCWIAALRISAGIGGRAPLPTCSFDSFGTCADRGESADVEGEDFVMTLLSRCNGHDILESCGCGGLRTAKRPSLGRFEERRQNPVHRLRFYEYSALRIGHCGRCVVSSLKMDETMGRYSWVMEARFLSLVEAFLIPF